MRDLILQRLNEILEESDGLLENPFDDQSPVTTIEELKEFDDEELLDFFEFTVGFQG